MTLQIDLSDISRVEFGVGLKGPSHYEFTSVPTDSGVKSALIEMVQATARQLDSDRPVPQSYEPTEKYVSGEYSVVASGDPLEAKVREIHEIDALPPDSGALTDPSRVSCYFARLEDNHGRRLTAIRQATYFKGVLGKKLLRFYTDSLQMVDDRVFKLDNDFDLLIDSDHTHILRSRAFESIAQLKAAILGGVKKNVSEIQQDLDFVDFRNVESYASTHVLAAGCLASIRQQDLAGITPTSLISECKRLNVAVNPVNGKVSVHDEDVMNFLRVLDRRRYRSDLVSNDPEHFMADSRRKI